MIDVVAVMFDFVLDDKDLSDSIKALIGRLQIPILKVAIIDKKFFSNRLHPAHKLLNTIAEATAGWSDEADRQDALYAKLEHIVHRVLEEFSDNIEIFFTLETKLDGFLNEEREQASVERAASKRPIENQERAQLAKRKAHGEVQKRLSRASVLGFVCDFIIGYWKDVLMLNYLEESELGQEWRNRLDTMDDLLWSIALKDGQTDRSAS